MEKLRFIGILAYPKASRNSKKYFLNIMICNQSILYKSIFPTKSLYLRIINLTLFKHNSNEFLYSIHCVYKIDIRV